MQRMQRLTINLPTWTDTCAFIGLLSIHMLYALHKYCTGFLIKSSDFQLFGCRLLFIQTLRPQKTRIGSMKNIWTWIEKPVFHSLGFGSFISSHQSRSKNSQAVFWMPDTIRSLRSELIRCHGMHSLAKQKMSCWRSVSWSKVNWVRISLFLSRTAHQESPPSEILIAYNARYYPPGFSSVEIDFIIFFSASTLLARIISISNKFSIHLCIGWPMSVR